MEQNKGAEDPRTCVELLEPGLEPAVLQNPKGAPGLEIVVTYLRDQERDRRLKIYDCLKV